jgi:hypothetical protein
MFNPYKPYYYIIILQSGIGFEISQLCCKNLEKEISIVKFESVNEFISFIKREYHEPSSLMEPFFIRYLFHFPEMI